MKGKIVPAIMLTLLLTGMLALAFKIQPAKASGTIYIRADGSIDPQEAPISTIDNVTYTFTDNINDSIVVERDNIAVDGAAYTVQGTGGGNGIDLTRRNNVTIKNMEIKAFYHGVCLGIVWVTDSSSNHNSIVGNKLASNIFGIALYSYSSYNSIFGNNVTANQYGIYAHEGCSNNIIRGNNIIASGQSGVCLLYSANYNSVSENNITSSCYYGIHLAWSSYNSIVGNNITNNALGINIIGSSNNRFYHNNFIGNTQQVYIDLGYANFWDDGYPSGGNYWSDYTGVDKYSGSNQGEPSSDGIGDTPYVIDANNQDRYPLMVQWGTPYPYYDWPLTQHDARRTGYSTSLAPNTNSTLWIYATGGPVDNVVVADGKVFVASADYKVYALDATTGELIWNYTTGGVAQTVSVCYGRVFAPSGDGKFYALNATTGAFDWSYPMQSRAGANFADGKVYIGSLWPDNKLYALNATTGAYIWSFQVGGDYTAGSPSLADGKVFFGAGDWNIYALNASTGTLIWSYQTGGYTVHSLPSVVDGKVIIGSDDGKVYALNATDGSLIWNYTAGYATTWMAPAVAYDKVFVGSNDHNVIVALNTTTGALIWNYTAGGGMHFSAVADGKVFVASGDYKVYALDATTGELVWNYQTGGSVYSPVIADGKVYIGSKDYKVYAFGPAHDVAVTEVMPSKTIVGQGYGLNINVTAANQGDTETFNVTLYANTTIIASQAVTLTSGSTTTLTFLWNTTGWSKGNYTISAYAWPVQGEVETADNTLSDGAVLVGVPCDVTGPTPGVPDGVCNMRDIGFICAYFGARPGDPRWEQVECRNCDVNDDGVVNMRDIGMACDNFMKT